MSASATAHSSCRSLSKPTVAKLAPASLQMICQMIQHSKMAMCFAPMALRATHRQTTINHLRVPHSLTATHRQTDSHKLLHTMHWSYATATTALQGVLKSRVQMSFLGRSCTVTITDTMRPSKGRLWCWLEPLPLGKISAGRLLKWQKRWSCSCYYCAKTDSIVAAVKTTMYMHGATTQSTVQVLPIMLPAVNGFLVTCTAFS